MTNNVERHNIPLSSFYNAVTRLRKRACAIPESTASTNTLYTRDFTSHKNIVSPSLLTMIFQMLNAVMLADISGVDAVYIACGRITVIQEQFSMDIDHALFLFYDHRRVHIKAILKKPDGIVLICNLLTGKGRYHWPRDKSEVRNLLRKELGFVMARATETDTWLPDSQSGHLYQEPRSVSVHISGICNFSNNLNENVIRPFVVGCKRWLFNDTPARFETSAVIYMIVEKSKRLRIPNTTTG